MLGGILIFTGLPLFSAICLGKLTAPVHLARITRHFFRFFLLGSSPFFKRRNICETAVWHLEKDACKQIWYSPGSLIDYFELRRNYDRRVLLNFCRCGNSYKTKRYLEVKVRGPFLGGKARGPWQLPTLPCPKTATVCSVPIGTGLYDTD